MLVILGPRSVRDGTCNRFPFEEAAFVSASLHYVVEFPDWLVQCVLARGKPRDGMVGQWNAPKADQLRLLDAMGAPAADQPRPLDESGNAALVPVFKDTPVKKKARTSTQTDILLDDTTPKVKTPKAKHQKDIFKKEFIAMRRTQGLSTNPATAEFWAAFRKAWAALDEDKDKVGGRRSLHKSY